jgi:MFS family permease
MMPRRQLAAVILASALITLDGTATTVALPSIARSLGAPVTSLQWITNAPLLILAALLLPAGTLADRYGRVWMMRCGLVIFVAASLACAMASSVEVLIASKFAQGAGAALLLPAALAMLRSAHPDADERARIFGAWAAWTGGASAVGPLLAGGLIDLVSWRAIFVPSALAGGIALSLLRADTSAASATRPQPLPIVATTALIAMLGGVAYLLMRAPVTGFAGWNVVPPIVVVAIGAILLKRDRHRDVLFPRELVATRNCLPANGGTFALYFGMFGLSFLVVLYVQQVLDYSALWSALVLLPMSLMLLLAERFGRLTSAMGTRSLIMIGTVSAAAGIWWMASGPQPVPFWSHIIVGTSLFGLGISLAVSALTNAAVAAVPQTCAGAAAGLHHAVVRAAGVASVALLGSIAAPGLSNAVSAEGVQRGLMICAVVVGTGGVAGGALLRDDEPGGVAGDD